MSNARGMPGGMVKLRFDWYIRYLKVHNILENVFTTGFPVILNIYTFDTSSREVYDLYHDMTGSVEAKTLFLDVTM